MDPPFLALPRTLEEREFCKLGQFRNRANPTSDGRYDSATAQTHCLGCVAPVCWLLGRTWDPGQGYTKYCRLRVCCTTEGTSSLHVFVVPLEPIEQAESGGLQKLWVCNNQSVRSIMTHKGLGTQLNSRYVCSCTPCSWPLCRRQLPCLSII